MSGMFRGYMTAANANLADADAAKAKKIDELRGLLAGERKANACWSNHYVALEAERDYLLKLLDEAHGGAENNPARQPAYSGENDKNFRIPVGPRKGQRVTRRDHHYLTAFIQKFSEKYSHMTEGGWKSWIDGRIWE
jgi:hypothetical protein